MTLKTLLAAAVSAAFALPIAATAADDKATSGATKSDGGAEAMFKALDKDNDGFISKEEAKGTPHDKDFSTLDKNADGKLSREEHAAAPEHANASASSGASTTDSKKPETSSQPKSKY